MQSIEEKEVLQSAIALRLVKEALSQVTVAQLLAAINTWIMNKAEPEDLKWSIYYKLLAAISELNPEREPNRNL